ATVGPREPNVHFGLGYLYLKANRLDEAKQEFNNELINDPTHAQAVAYLGDVEMRHQNAEGAILLLKKALQLKPDLRLAYMDLAAIYSRQKNYPDAIAALQRAMELDPSEPDAHYRLARIYQAQGKTAESKAEFAKVEQHYKKEDEDLAAKMPSLPQAR
ncbi:MAG: hypothetical protein DMG64_06560, partial [Acidobacteria bacterium]